MKSNDPHFHAISKTKNRLSSTRGRMMSRGGGAESLIDPSNSTVLADSEKGNFWAQTNIYALKLINRYFYRFSWSDAFGFCLKHFLRVWVSDMFLRRANRHGWRGQVSQMLSLKKEIDQFKIEKKGKCPPSTPLNTPRCPQPPQPPGSQGWPGH